MKILLDLMMLNNFLVRQSLFSYSFVRKNIYFVKEMKDSFFIIDDIKKRKDVLIK